jgi:peptide/nickel transport system permease protein
LRIETAPATPAWLMFMLFTPGLLTSTSGIVPTRPVTSSNAFLEILSELTKLHVSTTPAANAAANRSAGAARLCRRKAPTAMFSRCLYGAQLSVIIGLSAAALATVVSIFIGIVSGYLGGKFDMIMQRFVDAWMCFPDLIILIVVVSVVGPGMGPVIVILGLLYGIGGSRIIRGAVLSVRENAYVHAAQSTGATLPRILWKHILPNVMAPVIVLFTTRVGAVILAESGLAFLGLGVPPPAPTWGGMLSGSGRSYMYMAPWLALAPGLCITVVVYAINVFGDSLRDLLDPRMRGSR